MDKAGDDGTIGHRDYKRGIGMAGGPGAPRTARIARMGVYIEPVPNYLTHHKLLRFSASQEHNMLYIRQDPGTGSIYTPVYPSTRQYR